eukprot:6492402-Amphidinium_carterae.1
MLGSNSADTILMLLDKLEEALADYRAEERTVFDAAITDVLSIATCLRGLLEKGRHLDMKALDKMLDAKTGQQQIIGSAMKQQAWWAGRVKLVRQTHVMSAALMPEVEDSRKLLGSNPSIQAVADILPKMHTWRDSLQEGTCLSSYCVRGDKSRGAHNGSLSDSTLGHGKGLKGARTTPAAMFYRKS